MRRIAWTVIVVATLLGCAAIETRQAPVQVFILAGQSNMEGQAVVDLDHEQYYNGGRGTLARLMSKPKLAARLAHLRHADGAWVERDDVFVWYRAGRDARLKAGKLSIGYAVYPGKHHFGPELQFGHVVGDAIDAPVLLLKAAWGGKSLHEDFRPPSARGAIGAYYEKMLAECSEALGKLGEYFPSLADRRYEIAGFVWFQGWNDMFNMKAVVEYADNLAHLIRDVRAHFGKPALPVVIGETGNTQRREIGAQQAAVAARKDFAGTVRFVSTRAFLRDKNDSPNVTHGHHWFGNAESYFLIGDAFGHAMLELLGRPRSQRPIP